MKLDKIPERLDPSLDLEQIRAECLELTKKRAYYSAVRATTRPENSTPRLRNSFQCT